MARVPAVLLDHVDQHPTQRRGPPVLLRSHSRDQATEVGVGGQRRVQVVLGARDGFGEQRVELAVRGASRAVPVPVGVIVPRRGVPRRHLLLGRQVVGEPVVLDEGQVLQHSAKGEVTGRKRLIELIVGEARRLEPDGRSVVVEEAAPHPDLVVVQGRL